MANELRVLHMICAAACTISELRRRAFSYSQGLEVALALEGVQNSQVPASPHAV